MERLRPRDGERAWVRKCGLERERDWRQRKQREQESLSCSFWGGGGFL